MGEWGVLLNGIYLSGGDGLQWDTIFASSACTGLSSTAASGAAGCLSTPPDGLGLPGLRTEDVTYTQRDGVRHFRDWYEPRIITLENVMVCSDGCPGCTNSGPIKSARAHVQDLVSAWSRQCDDQGNDSELVIYTDCHTPGASGVDRDLNGPFGIVGRPRVASLNWIGQGSSCARMTLRFDAQDQRIFVLDECGTPGYGKSLTVPPGILQFCHMGSICASGDGWCFSTPVTGGIVQSVSPTSISIGGTQCVSPTITLWPQLTGPRVENLTTSDYFIYNDIIESFPVIVNTEDMTATQNGESKTHLLLGNGSFSMDPGDYLLRIITKDDADDGYATVTWRDTVVMA